MRVTCGPRKTFIKKGMGLRPCENIKTNLVHWAELDININTLRLSKHSIRNVGLKYDRHLLFPNLLPVHVFFPDKQRCFGCSSCKVGEGFYFWCVRVKNCFFFVFCERGAWGAVIVLLNDYCSAKLSNIRSPLKIYKHGKLFLMPSSDKNK